MNKWANTVITEKGLALLAKLTQGNTLNITEAVTGAGFVTPGLLVKQTGVSDPKQNLTFRTVSYPETGKCAVPMFLTNEDLDTAYDATQLGVFADDPDEGKILFFISQAIDANSGTHIPSEAEMPSYSAEWTFTFKYGQADNVTVVVDPSNSVSQTEMAEYVESHMEVRLTEFKNSLNGVDIVTTAGNGADYTATVPGITALKAGLTLTIIPHTVSTDVLPTLNVNGLGAKQIRRRVSNSTVTTVASAQENWLGANRPIRVTYDGTFWIADLDRPNAIDIYGTLAIANGGTGATTAETALSNLGAAPVDHSHNTLLLGSGNYGTVDPNIAGIKGVEGQVYFVISE